MTTESLIWTLLPDGLDLETGDLPLALDATGDFLRRHAGGCALAIRGRSVVGLVQRPRGRHAEWAAGLAGHLRGLALAPLIGISGPIPALSNAARAAYTVGATSSSTGANVVLTS